MKAIFIDQILGEKRLTRHVTEETIQGDEEEDLSSYWMILRNSYYSGNSNTKQQINLCGELALEGNMGRTIVTQTTE